MFDGEKKHGNGEKEGEVECGEEEGNESEEMEMEEE